MNSMEIKIIKARISRKELSDIASKQFGDLVKAAVDIEKGIMALGGELHMDEEVTLIEQEGSRQEHVWGVNLYPNKSGDAFVEFDSMINLKPAVGNRSRSVDNIEIREKIQAVIGKLVSQ